MHDSTSTSSGVAMSSRDAELSSQKRKSQLLQQIDDQFMEDSELLLQLSNDSYGSDDDDDVEDIQELTDDLEIAAIDFACSPNSKEAEEALTNIVSDQKQQPPSESTTSMYWESIMTTVSERARERERESVCVCVCACVNIMADR
jgi:DNA-binding FadR family transcriptional regulator